MRGNALLIFKDQIEEGEAKEPVAAIHGEDITAVQLTNSGRKSKGDTNVYFEVFSKHGVENLAAENEKETSGFD